MFPRLKHQLTVFASLGAGLLVITLFTALGGLWQYGHELDSQKVAKPLAGTAQFIAAQDRNKAGSSAQAAAANSRTQGSSPANLSAPFVTSQSQDKSDSTTTGSSKNNQANSGPASVISLSLSVNGQAKGSVKLPLGSNQCEVLSQALAEGIIGSLDMRYSQSYGTEGVYVINGLGDPQTVWWTYKVNGTAPPYGCGYVTAHDGDSVSWQYVKS